MTPHGRARGLLATGLGLAIVVCLVVAGTVIASARPQGPGISGAPAVASGADVPVLTTSADAGPLNPGSPLELTVAHGSIESATVTDTDTGKPVPGSIGRAGTQWTSTGPLEYGATYSVAVDTMSGDGTRHHETRSINSLDPKLTAYPSFIPPPSATDVGVGQPLVVRFDHPVHDRAAAEKALTVTTSPEQPGSWYWLSDTEAHYRGETYWKPGSTITLKADLLGVDLGQGTFGDTNRTETIHVHDAWIAKADGKSETMQIFDNDKLVNTMPISLGSPGHPSHVGPHVISDKQPSITMDSCTYGVCQGQPGYYKEKVDLDLRISDDGEFVHSAPWSVGSQGGANVSHGCVNLSPANAQWMFDHFGVGDVVEVTNSGGPTLPIYDTYGDWELSWAQWQAGSAL